jgi:beta-hydroxylase
VVAELLTPKFIVVYVFLASALFIHFRGRDRLRFARQLTDHSTFTAPYNALMYLFSAVPTTPRLAVEEFPDLAPLSANWQVIREEARMLSDEGHIRKSDKHNDVAFNTFFKRGWKRFYLKWYGEPLPSARELCPRTLSLIESIPSINAAMFTFLPPQSRLGRHRDPFAGSLRYHLGLDTPNSDACRIYIDGEPYSWRDGEAVLFDETFIHSVENETDESRLILFCDVARPLRTPVMRALNAWVTRHVVKISATQNVDTEKVGVLNRVSSLVHRYGQLLERFKAWNRPLYYASKWAAIAGGVYLVFFRWI